MRADRYASFFVVNLCVVDLVAAAVVMPWSLAGGVSSQTSSTNVTLQSGVVPRSLGVDTRSPRLVDSVKTLRHEIDHFGDVIRSQSLGMIVKLGLLGAMRRCSRVSPADPRHAPLVVY